MQLQKCNALTDSLTKANKQIDENDFIETTFEKLKQENTQTEIPIIYFNIFIIIALACGVFIFKNKR